MIGVLTVYIWAIILLLIGIGVVLVGVAYWLKARRILEDAKKSAERVEKRTNMKFNRIATMSMAELNQYLADVYSIALELSAVSFVSENDPKHTETLYACSVAAVHTYLGEETIAAIEYYYGRGFVIKWCEQHYRLLENRQVILRVINRDIRADGIRSNMVLGKYESRGG